MKQTTLSAFCIKEEGVPVTDNLTPLKYFKAYAYFALSGCAAVAASGFATGKLGKAVGS